jgi:uroporphyrin-III C-methyltransferase/precorrin-2 dehydrogenase/sirohydrochlorin ferrochelatase
MTPIAQSGFVSLVGAGPGDPELLTVRAARRLAEADLVLYDALVAPGMLDLAPRAQRFFVGKRARKKAVAQETIHWLMIRAARRGKKVVRLKCGDPFVFGRGGEEALALLHAGIPFEVVPGVSSAIAAPALAGIPVTHRGTASGFVVVSGHSPAAYTKILESIAPHSLTIVVLMGLAQRSTLASFLIRQGWNPRTPAAVLLAASTPAASTWMGTLAQLAVAPELSVEEDSDSPGTLVVGDVVAVAAQLAQAHSTDAAAAAGRRHS